MMEIRLATMADSEAIKRLMERAIATLQEGFLDKEQIAASRAGMGFDPQLVKDQSYFCVEEGGALAGCGGWSMRRTLYGGGHSMGRDPALLDPGKDRARIRAMYTDPDFVRRGVATLILRKAEEAALYHGFHAIEMAATMSGVPFYLKENYVIESRWTDDNGAVPVPLATMVKFF